MRTFSLHKDVSALLNVLKRSVATWALREWVARRAPWHAERRRAAKAFYAHWIRAGDLVFDVGAHRGNRTELFAALGARVVCLEPQRSCAQHLSRRFRNNPNVIIVPKGVGEKDGTAQLSVCEGATTISTLSNKWKTEGRFAVTHRWTTYETIPLTTLDALIDRYGAPKFCKIDVEGSEEAVLRGLSRALPCLSFEFTREFFSDAQRCMERLSALGPTEFNCSIGESMRLFLPAWVSSERLSDTLQSSEDRLLWGDIYARSLSPLA